MKKDDADAEREHDGLAEGVAMLALITADFALLFATAAFLEAWM